MKINTVRNQAMRIGGGIISLLYLMAISSSLAKSDISVREDLIAVSAPGENGSVTVRGAPGAVMSQALITFILENDDTDIEVNGAVHTDGSFIVNIQASPGDELKIVFISSRTAKKEKVKRDVPPISVLRPMRIKRDPPGQRSRLAPTKRLYLPRPTPTPEIVIRYRTKSEKAAAGAKREASSRIKRTQEISRSGVLPPD